MRPIAPLTIAASLVLSACGGGGGGGSSSSSSSPAVFSGTVSGFGSVIVNGTRFSSAGATLRDDDGNAVNLNQLHIGMTVDISGTSDDAAETGSANVLEVEHGIRGQVTAKDTGLGTITVLNQTIKIDSTTAFQGVADLTSLNVGQTVEVYGSAQADGTLLATLVEVKVLTALSVIGPVSNVTGTTFDIGTLTVNFSSATVNGTLVNGGRVKVKAAAGALSGNTLTATSVKVLGAGSAWGTFSTAGARIKLKGVADTAPVNGLLTVSGTPVNVSNATIEGSGSITAGHFIEVKGTWDGSVMQATKVELEGAREARIGGRNELYGVVSSLAGSIAVVNGVSVDLSAAVFRHGSLGQVSVGSYVEIKGNMVGNTLQATKVELKNGSEKGGVSFEQFGAVTDFVSLSNFKLNGIVVDASQATFDDLPPSSIANGTYVEIKGAVNSNGVLVATKVEVKGPI
jgi:hypothetical protein